MISVLLLICLAKVEMNDWEHLKISLTLPFFSFICTIRPDKGLSTKGVDIFVGEKRYFMRFLTAYLTSNTFGRGKD